MSTKEHIDFIDEKTFQSFILSLKLIGRRWIEMIRSTRWNKSECFLLQQHSRFHNYKRASDEWTSSKRLLIRNRTCEYVQLAIVLLRFGNDQVSSHQSMLLFLHELRNLFENKKLNFIGKGLKFDCLLTCVTFFTIQSVISLCNAWIRLVRRLSSVSRRDFTDDSNLRKCIFSISADCFDVTFWQILL